LVLGGVGEISGRRRATEGRRRAQDRNGTVGRSTVVRVSFCNQQTNATAQEI